MWSRWAKKAGDLISEIEELLKIRAVISNPDDLVVSPENYYYDIISVKGGDSGTEILLEFNSELQGVRVGEFLNGLRKLNPDEQVFIVSTGFEFGMDGHIQFDACAVTGVYCVTIVSQEDHPQDGLRGEIRLSVEFKEEISS